MLHKGTDQRLHLTELTRLVVDVGNHQNLALCANPLLNALNQEHIRNAVSARILARPRNGAGNQADQAGTVGPHNPRRRRRDIAQSGNRCFYFGTGFIADRRIAVNHPADRLGRHSGISSDIINCSHLTNPPDRISIMLHRITQQTSVSYPFFYRNLMIINHFFFILHTFLKQNHPRHLPKPVQIC